jgi:hypothetical protein
MPEWLGLRGKLANSLQILPCIVLRSVVITTNITAFFEKYWLINRCQKPTSIVIDSNCVYWIKT